MAFNNNNTTTTGATGAHGNVPAGGDHKPSMGEKLSGTMDKMVGKMTNNPAKVEEGEAKKRGDTVTAQQADAAADAHKNTGAHSAHTGTHTGTGAGVGATGAGLGSHTGTHGDHGVHGTHGTHTGPAGTTGTTGIHTDSHHTTGATGTGVGHKAPGEPTMGDKMTGTAQTAAGRATNDPVQYAQGQERKTDTSFGNTAGAGYGSGVGGAGVGTGAGLGHDNYGTSGGPGLTGSHHTPGNHTGATGAGVGGVGHNTHDAHHNNNPGMGQKISGGMDKMVGKATNDPERVREGELKTGNPSTTGATTGAYGTGPGATGTHGTTGGAY